jgi:hypothetical protein
MNHLILNVWCCDRVEPGVSRSGVVPGFPLPDSDYYELLMNDYPYDFGFWDFTNSHTDNRSFFLGEDIPGHLVAFMFI